MKWSSREDIIQPLRLLTVQHEMTDTQQDGKKDEGMCVESALRSQGNSLLPLPFLFKDCDCLKLSPVTSRRTISIHHRLAYVH